MNIIILISVAAAGMAALVLIAVVVAGGRAEKRIQRTIPLLLLAACAAVPCTASADSLWAIYGGRSYHLDPSISRSLLNQDQHTAGLSWQHGRWELQVSHMTDSFSCPSDEAAGLYHWPLLREGILRAGLEAGIFVAHRCIGFRTVSGVIHSDKPIPKTALPPGTFSWIYTCGAPTYPQLGCQYDYWRRTAGAAREHWVIGAMPVGYIQVWRLRLEVGLIVTGPMDGAGDAVLYGQLAVKIASW